MTRPLAVLAFLLLAFAFVELWIFYNKLKKHEDRLNLAEYHLSKLPPLVVHDGPTSYPFINYKEVIQPGVAGWPTKSPWHVGPLEDFLPKNPEPDPLAQPPKRKPAAKRRRRSRAV